MTPETIGQFVQTLAEVYGEGLRVAHEGQQTLARISEVELYPTCQPSITQMLLVFDPAQPKPVPYVQPGQLLENGRSPRGTSVQLVGGESWLQFSFNVPWAEEDGIMRFLAAARQRFAQHD
jgi:hypothetical protein